MGVIRQLVPRPLGPVGAVVLEHGRRAGHHRGTALIRVSRWKSGTAPRCSAAVAERRAREALQRIHRAHRIPVHIETIKSLDGAWIADVARRRGRMARAEQLYILVAGDERDVGVIAARHGAGKSPHGSAARDDPPGLPRAAPGGRGGRGARTGRPGDRHDARLRRRVQAETERPGCPDLGGNPRGGLGGPPRLPDSGMVRGQEQAAEPSCRRST